ncbi:hypothetical protein PATSB16_23910 [Pandoraea thiooxydans]|uniref:FAD-binding FR-type domain-containing protein n=1 Tax=Pandoraea thiooxydans TaxID=445709 RepID=A0A0G3ESV4_9BURK|nr:ferredoxin reductase family protein [Pandoraea thiooxydans]AKJ68382.1 hypothetical protein ABW99_09300 [Pandoraea thiooxydans]APR95731.1 hypothetical protein PATSB16_23910 [Pandoraea thiooxydans]
MNAGRRYLGTSGLAAPALLLALSLGAVWLNFPGGLRFWRASAIVLAWAGTGALVGSLTLMVREPHWAALMGGLDAMYRWHHRGGVIGYVLLLCHPLALGMAGVRESPRTAWLAISPWHLSWPEWLGWLGVLCLMAGLTSTFSQRTSYRRWQAFHYLTALGVASGLAHVFVLLGDARNFLGFIAVAAVALAWRLLAVDRGLTAHPFRVTQVARKAANMIEASLAPCAGAVPASPGQFLLVAFGDGPGYRGCEEFHPFTVSAIGAQGDLSVAIKAMGPCTRRIQSLRPGVLVRVQGPFGHFLASAPNAPQLWIAGGIGITPFIAAIRAGGISQQTTLIYLYREERDAAFLDELKARAGVDANFELIAEAVGKRLPDVPRLLSRVTRLRQRQVQICGPAGLVKALRSGLRELGVLERSIHYESFDFR